MPFGYAVVRATSRELESIDLVARPVAESEIVPMVLSEARRQMLAYLEDSAWQFNLPMRTMGTPYQQRVWASLRNIPASRVKTYGQLAAELSSGPRAIAMACRSNEFPLIVPCHRVVAMRGLGGYAGHSDGHMLDIKRWLLTHEGATFA
jgi:methylated-DNA-[protein]-cysteine S-methyltransferase